MIGRSVSGPIDEVVHKPDPMLCGGSTELFGVLGEE